MTKGCLSLFNYFIDMRPEVMSPFFVKKNMFFPTKTRFFTKNEFINSGFMSKKQLNKERQPLDRSSF